LSSSESANAFAVVTAIMFRSFFTPLLFALIGTPVIIWSTSVGGAQVMTSENFLMESDSLNVSGGSATSESYLLENTVGEAVVSRSTSESYILGAGFQQMQGSQLAKTSPLSVTMNPSIPGVAGGIANGTTSVTVTTDNAAGYQLTIVTETSPALIADDGITSIADYVPSSDADLEFSVTDTDSHMGYTVQSADAVARFFHNNTVCGGGSVNTGTNCWVGLSTTSTVIAQGIGATPPEGTPTTIYFRTGVGGSVVQRAGVYMATTTLTAIPL
jgi:hypothetical protein